MRMDTPFGQPQGVLGFAQQRPRSPLRRIGAVFGVLVLLGAGAGVVSVLVPQGAADAEPVTMTVPADTREAARALRAHGVLRFPNSFRALLALRGGRVASGTYTVSPHLSVWSLVDLLTTTRPRPERIVQIIEGWNLRDVAAYFEREGIADANALFALVGAPATDYRFADPALPRPKDFSTNFPLLRERPAFVSYEGYLFPDTYRVYADASLEDIVQKMFVNLERKMTPELREEIAKSGRSVHQILTMASIVEAEISRAEDRPIAAGVLWKRRDRGMLLQVDASVNYVTGKHDPRVSRDDAGMDSAYNTYRYAGLPRGPIGNPGMDAILATLRPQSSPYWFFLTTKGGQTVFSRTLEEHNANVARHLAD